MWIGKFLPEASYNYKLSLGDPSGVVKLSLVHHTIHHVITKGLREPRER